MEKIINLKDEWIKYVPRRIYTISKDGTLDQIDIQDKTYVLPCITIAKENLKAGQGSIDDPYRTE